MKFRFLLITLILSSTIAYTQNFNGGIITGLTASQISGDNLAGYNKLGFDVGGFVNLNTGRFTSLEMEMKYIQKGSKSQFSPFDTSAEQRHIYRLQLNYIDIPIIFKYNLRGISKHQSDSSYHLLNRLTVEIGLSYAVFLSKSEVDAVDLSIPLSSQPFKKYDFSVIAGLYYEINPNLFVNFRRTGTIFLFPVRPHAGEARHGLNWGQYNDVVELTLHFFIHSHKDKTEQE